MPFEITFNKKGIKEAFNQNHDFYHIKETILPYIDTILETAEYIGQSEDFKGNPMVKAIHYFKIPIGDGTSYAILREMKDKKILFYSLTDNEKVLKDIKKPN